MRPPSVTALAPMPVSVFPADPCFIGFNNALKLIDAAAHRATEPMTHEPACSIVGAGIFAEHGTMNLESADPFLAGQHQVRNAKPNIERNLGVLKDRVRDDGEPIPAVLAASERLAFGVHRDFSALAHPMKRLRPERNHTRIAASRAYRPIRPSALSQQLLTRIFVWKLSLKGFHRLHGSDSTLFHDWSQYQHNPRQLLAIKIRKAAHRVK